MAGQLNLEIITSEQEVMSTEAEWITIPGTLGEMTILPEHMPLVTTLESGVLQYSDAGQVKKVAIHYGYAQVREGTVTILSHMAETQDKMDKQRASDAEKKAREELQALGSAQGDEEYRMKKYEAKLERAIIRQLVN